MLPPWKQLAALAESEVETTLAKLPPKLLVQARELPVTYEPFPNDDLLNDGIEPDTLGLFVGGEFSEEEHVPIPAQIILFLENIWLMIEDEGGGENEFRHEVRTTLLHELGHYLGLDEGDLEERGLE